MSEGALNLSTERRQNKTKSKIDFRFKAPHSDKIFIICLSKEERKNKWN